MYFDVVFSQVNSSQFCSVTRHTNRKYMKPKRKSVTNENVDSDLLEIATKLLNVFLCGHLFVQTQSRPL